jgi:hypothetical protein
MYVYSSLLTKFIFLKPYDTVFSVGKCIGIIEVVILTIMLFLLFLI